MGMATWTFLRREAPLTWRVPPPRADAAGNRGLAGTLATAALGQGDAQGASTAGGSFAATGRAPSGAQRRGAPGSAGERRRRCHPHTTGPRGRPGRARRVAGRPSRDSRLLRRIAERRPATIGDLARAPGMEERRTERFDPAFLSAGAGRARRAQLSKAPYSAASPSGERTSGGAWDSTTSRIAALRRGLGR